jgi:hypothetical protein
MSRNSTADTGRCQSLGSWHMDYKNLPRENKLIFLGLYDIKTWNSFKKKTC